MEFNPLRWRKEIDQEPFVPGTAMVQRIDSQVKAVLAEFADLREARDRAYADRDQAIAERNQARAERDQARAEYLRAEDLVIKATEYVNEIKSRCTIYQLERDEAMARVGPLEGLIKSIKAMLDAHGIVAPSESMPTPDYSHNEMLVRINGNNQSKD